MLCIEKFNLNSSAIRIAHNYDEKNEYTLFDEHLKTSIFNNYNITNIKKPKAFSHFGYEFLK